MRVNTALATTASTPGPEIGNVKGSLGDAAVQAISLPPSKDWSAVLQRSLDRFRAESTRRPNAAQYMQHMSELLKIQSDISRYQLKVELVSKVSEGAVASVRKLQQNQ